MNVLINDHHSESFVGSMNYFCKCPIMLQYQLLCNFHLFINGNIDMFLIKARQTMPATQMIFNMALLVR